MTITSRFYDTTPGNGIKENEWAVSAVSRGATYGVVGANGLDLTPHPSTPYTLNIGPALEGFWGHGVWDVSDAQVTLPAVTPPATNATRWDLVAARRDWQPTGGGPTALVVVEGTTAMALPANRANTPGEVDDQPLWLVQWRGGETQPIATIDLRCWSGPGGVAAKDTLALQYLAVPGAEVRIGQTVWRYSAQANNQWAWEPDYGVQVDGIPAGKRPIIKAGAAFLRNPENTANRTNAAGDGYIYFDTAFPQEMVSFNVDVANNPTQWDAPSEKFTLNMNRIYATRQRLSVRVSNKDGVTVGNRDGIFVTYTAVGY